VLSLGAGQQSSALLLMSAAGLLPKLDLVVFADTQWERRVVYDHLEVISSRARDAGIRVERVTVGNLRESAVGDFVPMPVFGKRDGHRVVMRQMCTVDWKIVPIRRAIREAAGPLAGLTVELWLGISLEEMFRMKPSPVNYIEHTYPLIDMRWTRQDCVSYLASVGISDPPRSSCIACPYKSVGEWRAMKRDAPDEWADAVDFDASLRSRPDPLFVHQSLKPLPLVLSRPEQGELWNNECEGHCGV